MKKASPSLLLLHHHCLHGPWHHHCGIGDVGGCCHWGVLVVIAGLGWVLLSVK
jgi:hypothetical protein